MVRGDVDGQTSGRLVPPYARSVECSEGGVSHMALTQLAKCVASLSSLVKISDELSFPPICFTWMSFDCTS